MTAPARLPGRAALGLFALALAPRLALALAFLHAPIGLDDMHQYDMLARSLAQGAGYRWYGREDVERLRPYLERYYGVTLPAEQVPSEGFVTTFRAPGYPAALAGVYALAGLERRLEAARLLQALLGAALAPLSALLALELGLGLTAARRAGAAVGLYPILWMYPIGLASENTFIPLALAGTIVTLRAGRGGGLATAAAAGSLLGAAALTRGALAPFLAVAALWLAWRPASPRRGLAQAAVFTLCAAALLLPWSVRNSLLHGRPAFVENSAGYNLFVGYHPESDGSLNVRASVIPLSILDDAARDRWAAEQALGFIRDDPLRAAGLVARRLVHFWGLEDRELIYFYSNGFFGPIAQPWLLLGYLALVGPLVLLGLSAPFGMAAAPDRRGLALGLGLIASALAAYLPILAEPRFHLPLIPLLAAYAAHAWTAPGIAARTLASLRRGGAPERLAATAALALVTLWALDLAAGWPRLAAVLAPGGHALGLDY